MRTAMPRKSYKLKEIVAELRPAVFSLY